MSNRLTNSEWLKIMRRYGDGQHSSVREIAAEFGMAESTLRSEIKRGDGWTRDWLKHQLHCMRQLARMLDGELAEAEEELAKLRARTAK